MGMPKPVGSKVRPRWGSTTSDEVKSQRKALAFCDDERSKHCARPNPPKNVAHGSKPYNLVHYLSMELHKGDLQLVLLAKPLNA